MVKLGDKVKDSITGLAGIAVARAEYLYGCVRILIAPEEVRDGKPVEECWFDEQRLDHLSTARAGGPQPAPERQDAPRF